MYYCGSCAAEYYDYEPYRDHILATRHFPECETCERRFKNFTAVNQHMQALDHFHSFFNCKDCDSEFWQHEDLVLHVNIYCHDCERSFQNESNLRAHLNSRVHRGATVTCPFCKSNYTSASGLAHHLESGSCPRAPQLNREALIRVVRERDPHGFITNRQLTWHEGTRVTYSATERAWNGIAWECYLCHRCFNTANSLNQHLNSPTHQEKVYHCPNGGCGKEFLSLAALFNHLESESCAYMRFEQVQKAVHGVINSNRLIAF